MELRHLRYFTAIAHAQNFTRAAEQMLVAQPAISKQMADLEREVGTPLFIRTPKGVLLTAAGTRFHEDVKVILRLADEAVESARRAASGETGKLSIGFFSSPTAKFLSSLVAEYKKLYPAVYLELHELNPEKLLPGLLDGFLNIAFNRPVDSSEGQLLGKMELFKEQFKVVLPAGHSLSRKTFISVQEIKDEHIVLLARNEAPGLFDQITSFCFDHGFSPTISATAGLMSTVLTLVASGLGIGIVPETVQNIDCHGLVFVSMRPKIPHLSLECQWLEPLHSPTSRAFLELLRKRSNSMTSNFV
jgi:DNA-binding transcriptional LysR family regulator